MTILLFKVPAVSCRRLMQIRISVSFIGHLAVMLLISKGHIALQVQYGTGAVWVQPAGGKASSLLATLARNEELLAQVYLTGQERLDTRAQLVDYFQQRGWQVKGAGIRN